MPKIFSEKERIEIIETLQKGAMHELSRVGVRKTTVDELCRISHLAKGSFYLFYESKEELFLDCLKTFADSLEEMYLGMLQDLDENPIVSSLTTVFVTIAKRFRDEGMFRFLDEENIALIKRKVPEIRLKDLTDTLRNVFHTLFSYFSIENEDDIRAFEDGYLAVLHLFLIPDLENLDDTISFLIRGLVLQMVE